MTTFHCHVDLSAILRGDQVCLGFVRRYSEGWREASDAEIQTEAVIKQAKGMDGWPLCDGHDERGHCRGHAGA